MILSYTFRGWELRILSYTFRFMKYRFFIIIILFSSPSMDYLSKRKIFVFFSQVKDINKQQKPQNTIQNKNKLF